MRFREFFPLIALVAILVAGPAAADRGRVPVDPDEIRAALEASWADRAGEGETMEIVRLPVLETSAPGEVVVTWPDPPIPPGTRALTVGVRVDGRTAARGLANVIVRRHLPVWILTRSVARGDTLSAADLRREDRVWDRPPVRALTGALPPRGFVTLRALTAGQWIRHADVRARPDVEAGADLLLVTRSGDATVSLAAKARRSGFIGDTILVLNPLNGTVVRARLLDARHAELVSSHRSAERSRP